MKFLHLADLHLGRSLHERSLQEDQRAFIQEIGSILGGDEWTGLILAGDIYDRSIPSKEAVELLDELLALVHSRFPRLKILMIPGNHDSSSRLSYGQGLFSRLGIHIAGDPEDSFEPLWIEEGSQRAACFLLPFLAPGSLRGELDTDAGGDPAPLGNQGDLHREAARRLEEARRAAMEAGADYTILVAHLFATGGKESESERRFLGTAELVDIRLYSGFDYVALGHLHRRQQIAPNAWYAGSPLAWAFDEAGRQDSGAAAPEKGGIALSLGESGLSISMVNIQPLHPLSRITGTVDSFLRDPEWEKYRGHYLEIVLDGSELVENALALLRQRFPLLLSVKQDRALETLAQTAGRQDLIKHAGEDLKSDFDAFLKALYGQDHGRDEERALFEALLEEAEQADRDEGSAV